MAYKLRRPPLYSYKNGGATIYSQRIEKSTLQMDCGLEATYQADTTTTTGNGTTTTADGRSSRGTKDLHVNFEPLKKDIQERKKFLTAKYGSHQMALIKKRLSVEMWLYDQLQLLFGSETNESDFELDLDELLDIEAEPKKRKWLQDKLSDAKESQEVVHQFINELLLKAQTL